MMDCGVKAVPGRKPVMELYQRSHTVQSALSIHGRMVPGPPPIPKSSDAQVPYVKWQSAVSSPVSSGGFNQLQVDQNLKIQRVDCISKS